MKLKGGHGFSTRHAEAEFHTFRPVGSRNRDIPLSLATILARTALDDRSEPQRAHSERFYQKD